MIPFKIFLLSERKDHIIKRLKNLSDEEKKTLINHFKKYPNLESMIDWNNKNLTFDDFAEVLAYKSKRKKKKMLRDRGIKGLEEGVDYINIPLRNREYLAYAPLNYEASKAIASMHIGGCEGKWCTAYQKSRVYWHQYNYQSLKGKPHSVFVYIIGEGTKWAMDIHGNTYDIWNAKDDQIIKNGEPTLEGYTNAYGKSLGEIDIPTFPKDDVVNEIMAKVDIINRVRKIKVDKKFAFIEKARTRNAEYGTITNAPHGPGLPKVEADDVWFEGEWLDGVWHSGVFRGKRSVWHNGHWMGGSFEAPLWKNGVWETGYWNESRDKNATWKNGLWKFGYWIDGIWENGTWEDGGWLNGVWKNGIWKSGHWYDGTWLGGEWRGGTWDGGYDYRGNFHPMGDSPDKWDI